MASRMCALLLAAAVAATLAAASANHHHFSQFHDHQHPLFGVGEEDIKRELHYMYSWGYETPPPAELADHLTYYPPKEEGTIKHAREIHAKMHREEQEMLLMAARREEIMSAESESSSSSTYQGLGSGRHLLQFQAAAPVGEDAGIGRIAQAPGPDPCSSYNPNEFAAEDAESFNETIRKEFERSEAWRTVWGSMQQPTYPTDATAEIYNTSVQNTLQQFGRLPRYHRKYGIALKTHEGRWMTYVNKDVWWWGVDDWSTQLWTCRFTQPGPKGFDCARDRTCPGCDRCRGEHCFWNWNRHLYCYGRSCGMKSAIVIWGPRCVQTPIHCGMSRRVGTDEDIGFPGTGGP